LFARGSGLPQLPPTHAINSSFGFLVLVPLSLSFSLSLSLSPCLFVTGGSCRSIFRIFLSSHSIQLFIPRLPNLCLLGRLFVFSRSVSSSFFLRLSSWSALHPQLPHLLFRPLPFHDYTAITISPHYSPTTFIIITSITFSHPALYPLKTHFSYASPP
jgi:hypothetical protein